MYRMLGDSYLRSRPDVMKRLSPEQQDLVRNAYRYPSVAPLPVDLDFQREIEWQVVEEIGGAPCTPISTVRCVDPSVSIEYQACDGESEVLIHTPRGQLTETLAASDSAETVFRIKHALREENDFRVYEKILEERQFESSFESWCAAQANLETRGACFVVGPDLPLVSLFRVRDPALLLYDLADRPQYMRELLDLLHERTCEAYRLIAAGPGMMVQTGAAFLTTQIISPRIFERYVMPYLAEYVETVHKAGKLFLCHMCGFVRLLLPMLREVGVDGLDSLTNPPVGDTTLRDYWRLMGDDAILKSGISPCLLSQGSAEEIRQHTREVLRQPEGRHLVLATADDVPFGTPPSNLVAVAEALRVV